MKELEWIGKMEMEMENWKKKEWDFGLLNDKCIMYFCVITLVHKNAFNLRAYRQKVTKKTE